MKNDGIQTRRVPARCRKVARGLAGLLHAAGRRRGSSPSSCTLQDVGEGVRQAPARCKTSARGFAKLLHAAGRRRASHSCARSAYRCCQLLLLFSLSILKLPAQEIYYTATDSALCMRYLHAMHAVEAADGERIVCTAKLLLDKPYQAATLEREPEGVVVDLQRFDCTTFVETVLALSWESAENTPTFAGFVETLRQIRYRGEVVSYLERLHYLSDWVYENQQKGRIADVTSRLADSQPYHPQLFFMSTHPTAYPALKSHPTWVDSLRLIEQRAERQAPSAYLPKENFTPQAIQNGDLIAFVTRIPGLDVTHIGIAYWRNADELTFLHASSTARRVVIQPGSLQNYLKHQKQCRGIWILRPKTSTTPHFYRP